MDPHLTFGIAAVPAIAGLVEVCKDLGLPKRAAPLASLLFGVALGLLQFYSAQLPQAQSSILGAALGLSASGLYSGASALLSKPGPPGPTPPDPGPGEAEPEPRPRHKRTNERAPTVVRGPQIVVDATEGSGDGEPRSAMGLRPNKGAVLAGGQTPDVAPTPDTHERGTHVAAPNRGGFPTRSAGTPSGGPGGAPVKDGSRSPDMGAGRECPQAA